MTDPNQSNSVELSVEQQFELRSIELRIKEMDTNQLKGSLISIFNQMMLRENLYKERLAKHWRINPSATE